MSVSKPNAADADVLVHAEGYASAWMFEPVSDAAIEFFAENIVAEDWQHFGGKIAVDHRAARDLAADLYLQGFRILNPAYGWFVMDH
jgi:hypothetical protein